MVEVIDTGGAELGEQLKRSMRELTDVDASLESVCNCRAQNAKGLFGAECSALAENVDVFGQFLLGGDGDDLFTDDTDVFLRVVTICRRDHVGPQ